MNSTSSSLRRVEFAGLVLVGLLVLVSVGWAARTELSGAVIATGVVAAKENSKDVQHLEGGIVRAINVMDGQSVTAGTVLVRLDDTQIKAKLGIVENQLIEFAAEHARLEAERDNTSEISKVNVPAAHADADAVQRAIDGQKKHLVSIRETMTKKKEQLRERVAQIESNASGIEAKLVANEKQVTLAKAELEILQSLMEKGLTTRNRIFGMERELAQLQGQADDFRANVAALKAQIAETEFKVLEVEEQRRTEVTGRLSEVRAKIGDLLEQRNFELFRLRGTEIAAPISGRVHNLRVHTIDGVIAPGSTLMTLVPSDDALVFRMQIRPQDVDRVYVGQRVRLRFSTLNSRTTPEVEGSVAVVGADQLVETRSGATFFRIDVVAEPGALAGFETQKIRPGLPVEAFITTEQQTVMSYLFKPLLDQFAKAFRES